MPRNPFLDQVPVQEFPLVSYYLQDKLGTAGGGGTTFPYTGSAVIIGSLEITGSLIVSQSLDTSTRTLSDESGITSLTWDGERVLYDNSSNSSIDWNNRILNDSTSTAGVSWESGLNIMTSGPLLITSGSNTIVGTGTLSGGRATINNKLVTKDSLILLTIQSKGTTPGFLFIDSKIAETSFTVSSSLPTDASTFAYMIIN